MAPLPYMKVARTLPHRTESVYSNPCAFIIKGYAEHSIPSTLRIGKLKLHVALLHLTLFTTFEISFDATSIQAISILKVHIRRNRDDRRRWADFPAPHLQQSGKTHCRFCLDLPLRPMTSYSSMHFINTIIFLLQIPNK